MENSKNTKKIEISSNIPDISWHREKCPSRRTQSAHVTEKSQSSLSAQMQTEFGEKSIILATLLSISIQDAVAISIPWWI